MFGPDKCGEDYKLHFIFRHKNPLNEDMEEKHAKRADVDLKKFYTDKKTHLYTLGTTEGESALGCLLFVVRLKFHWTTLKLTILPLSRVSVPRQS